MNMSTQNNDTPAPKWAKITPDNQPVFPCWLWDTDANRWFRGSDCWDTESCKCHGITHWHADQPDAPTAQPAATGTPDVRFFDVQDSDGFRGSVAHESDVRLLMAQLAEARAEAETSAAEWATLMADVHDYFKDERADRGHGRVRLVLTLLGQLRCERDEAKAQLTARDGELTALRGLLEKHLTALDNVWDNAMAAPACRRAAVNAFMQEARARLATPAAGGKEDKS